eukprot:1107062-Pyramimonas_sp.AAC.1
MRAAHASRVERHVAFHATQNRTSVIGYGVSCSLEHLSNQRGSFALKLGYPSSFAPYSRSCVSSQTTNLYFPPRSGLPLFAAAREHGGHGK